jgi:hypothetical protein
VKGLIVIVGIVAMMVILPWAGDNDALAQCKSEVTLKAAYDYQLPKYSGTYDPCDNWLEWTMDFIRTGVDHDGQGISLEVSGTSVYQTFMAADFTFGHHIISDVEYVGPSSSHELVLDATINVNNQFNTIAGTVTYHASNPE